MSSPGICPLDIPPFASIKTPNAPIIVEVAELDDLSPPLTYRTSFMQSISPKRMMPALVDSPSVNQTRTEIARDVFHLVSPAATPTQELSMGSRSRCDQIHKQPDERLLACIYHFLRVRMLSISTAFQPFSIPRRRIPMASKVLRRRKLALDAHNRLRRSVHLRF